MKGYWQPSPAGLGSRAWGPTAAVAFADRFGCRRLSSGVVISLYKFGPLCHRVRAEEGSKAECWGPDKQTLPACFHLDSLVLCMHPAPRMRSDFVLNCSTTCAGASCLAPCAVRTQLPAALRSPGSRRLGEQANSILIDTTDNSRRRTSPAAAGDARNRDCRCVLASPRQCSVA